MNLLDAAVHHTLGGLTLLVSLLRGDRCALCTFRHFLGCRRHFVDRGSHLIRFVTLTLHRLFGTLRLTGNLTDKPGQLRCHTRDLLHQTMDFVDEAVKGSGKVTKLVLAGNRQAASKITLPCGDVVKIGFHQAKWAQQRAREDGSDCGDDDQNQHSDANDAEQHLLQTCFDAFFYHRKLSVDAIQIYR